MHSTDSQEHSLFFMNRISQRIIFSAQQLMGPLIHISSMSF